MSPGVPFRRAGRPGGGAAAGGGTHGRAVGQLVELAKAEAEARAGGSVGGGDAEAKAKALAPETVRQLPSMHGADSAVALVAMAQLRVPLLPDQMEAACRSTSVHALDLSPAEAGAAAWALATLFIRASADPAGCAAAPVAADALAQAGNVGGLKGVDLSRFAWGCARLAGGAAVPSAARWAGTVARTRLAELPPGEAVSLLWALAQLACEPDPGFLCDALSAVPPGELDAQRLQVALESVRGLVGEGPAPLTAEDLAAVGAWARECDRTLPRLLEGGLGSGQATALLGGVCALGMAPEAAAAFLVVGPGAELSGDASLDPDQAKLVEELRSRAARAAGRLRNRVPGAAGSGEGV